MRSLRLARSSADTPASLQSSRLPGEGTDTKEVVGLPEHGST